MFSSSSVSVLLTLSLTRLLSPSSAVGKMGLKGVPGLNIVRELPGREGGNSNGRGGGRGRGGNSRGGNSGGRGGRGQSSRGAPY